MRVVYILTLLTLTSIEVFGQITTSREADDDTIICVIGSAASYRGGMDSLKSFIKRNLIQSSNGTTGRVFVAFTIGEDGRANDFEIVRGLTAECDEKALEVARKMPLWTPATQNGKALSCRMVMPVLFE
ncbi:energy transducer TonB [Chryseolinea sp. T2]|uniref:energy transducer TonB n=1 Tax=Chryseolinea sp. T2 TaxID=3129255 RepID=UPI0030769F72